MGVRKKRCLFFKLKNKNKHFSSQKKTFTNNKLNFMEKKHYPYFDYQSEKFKSELNQHISRTFSIIGAKIYCFPIKHPTCISSLLIITTNSWSKASTIRLCHKEGHADRPPPLRNDHIKK